MATVFNILSQNSDTSQSRLFIEVGVDGISMLTYTNDTFTSLDLFSFKNSDTSKSIALHIQEAIASLPFLKQEFQKIDIIYSFSDSVLVPQDLMAESLNKEMLEFVYGASPEETVKRDLMYKHNLYNVYRIPSNVYSLMSGTFPTAVHTHLYSVLPDVLDLERGNHIYGIFASNMIIVMLKKQGKLQVIQHFKYKTPEDVAYYLLNMCRGFDAPVNETTLHISGMLDRVSALYTELHKYFLHIEFENLPGKSKYADGIKNYHPHFFSHFFAIASCV